MKTFHLVRLEDESGISGTGIVAEGCIFSNGRVVITWLTNVHSVIVYDSIDEVQKIHGHGSKTRIVYDNLKIVS